MAAKAEKPKEWWEELAFADPRERDAILAGMGYSRTGEFAGFAEDEEMFPEDEYAAAYLGEGLPVGFGLEGVGSIPEYTSKGALDPRDMTQVARGVNLAQDYGALFVDNALNSMLGPGAYGPDAFTPTYEYGKEIVPKGMNQLADLAGKGGWDGYLATRLQAGDSPSEAMASLQNFIEEVPEADRDRAAQDNKLFGSILNSMPRLQQRQQEASFTPGRGLVEPEDIGFWGDFDYDRMYEKANELWEGVHNDEPYAWQDPETGKLYDREPEIIKTPQMEWYDKYGLPYPTASYNDPEYLERILNAEEGTTPIDREAETSDYERAYGDVVGQTRRAEAALREAPRLETEMERAWEEYQRPVPPRRAPARTGPADNPYNLPASSIEAARTAAGLDLQGVLEAGVGAPTRDTYLQQAMARANLQPRTAGWGTSATSRDRDASMEAANTAADLDFDAAYEQWRDEQEARLLDEAMRRGATNRQPVPQQPILPMSITTPDGRMGLLGSRTAPQPGQGRGFGVVKPGATTRDPEFSPFRFITKEAENVAPLSKEKVSRQARYKRMRDVEARTVKAQQRQIAAEQADPRLNDIYNAAKLYWLAKAGHTPLGDVRAQRNLGARSLGL